MRPPHEQLLCDAFQDLPPAQLSLPVQWSLRRGEPADPLRSAPKERRARLVQSAQVHGEAHGALGLIRVLLWPSSLLLISLSVVLDLNARQQVERDLRV